MQEVQYLRDENRRLNDNIASQRRKFDDCDRESKRQISNLKKKLENAEADLRRTRRTESQLRRDRDELQREKRESKKKQEEVVVVDAEQGADAPTETGTLTEDKQVIADAVAQVMTQGMGSITVPIGPRLGAPSHGAFFLGSTRWVG